MKIQIRTYIIQCAVTKSKSLCLYSCSCSDNLYDDANDPVQFPYWYHSDHYFFIKKTQLRDKKDDLFS